MDALRALRPFLLLLALLPALALGQENWSPEEGSSSFEPSTTVLEQWSGLRDRTDKVMKKPDRHIMNRPPNREPGYQQPVTADKEVSETDLFLLGAIEKLAYRMEFLEKRLSRAEEMLFHLVSGNQLDEKQDPCPEQFKRIGGVCYHVSGKQVNWKSASSLCRNLNAALLELETSEERQTLVSTLQQDHQGRDYWTGGLNPGLLWIWSNSAKPVLTNATDSADAKPIDGNGRCLLLKYQALTKSYVYKGIDCSSRNYYICRYQENVVARHLRQLQKQLRFGNDTAHAARRSRTGLENTLPSEG